MRVKINREKLVAAISARREELVAQQTEPLTSAQFKKAMRDYRKRLVQLTRDHIKANIELIKELQQPETLEKLMSDKAYSVRTYIQNLAVVGVPKRCGHDGGGSYNGMCEKCKNLGESIGRFDDILRVLELSTAKEISLSEDDYYFRYI